MNSSLWSENSKYNIIIDIATAFQKSKVFFAAIELNIFSIIGDEKLSAKEICNKIQSDLRNTEKLLNALCALNFLIKHNDLYENSPITKHYLLENGEEYIGELHHINDLWNSWTDLTYCTKKGKPREFKTVNEKDSEWIYNYLLSLKWKSKYEAPIVVRNMHLRNCKRILDLGCGCGSYLIEISKNYPHLECVGLDYPNVVSQIEKVNQISKYENIKILPCDVYLQDIGSNYDAVLISYLLQEYSLWDNMELLRKVYNSLNKNGFVFIHQQVINDDKISPKSAVMNSLNMMVNTLEGDIMTETELWVILKENWFDNISFVKTDFDTTIVSGQKLTSF